MSTYQEMGIDDQNLQSTNNKKGTLATVLGLVAVVVVAVTIIVFALDSSVESSETVEPLETEYFHRFELGQDELAHGLVHFPGRFGWVDALMRAIFGHIDWAARLGCQEEPLRNLFHFLQAIAYCLGRAF